MLDKIFKKIENKEPFALIRFGDGEKNILNNIACNRKGFSYDPGDVTDRKFQTELAEALLYRGGENYFVGINDGEIEKHINGTKIDPMIFVNQNYLKFLKSLEEVGKNIPIVLVVNKKSKIGKLPFPYSAVFLLDDNAWRTAEDLDKQILNWLNKFKKPMLVLVAGGAYSCVLINKIWDKNQEHCLMDIGSTLDPWLYGVKTRQYQERLGKL